MLLAGLLSGESMYELSKLPLEKIVVSCCSCACQPHIRCRDSPVYCAIGFQHHLPNGAHQASQRQARDYGHFSRLGRVDSPSEFLLEALFLVS